MATTETELSAIAAAASTGWRAGPPKGTSTPAAMGATNPAEAAEDTIRRDFAISIGENTVHGSDSLENAAIESSYFFSQIELVNSAA